MAADDLAEIPAFTTSAPMVGKVPGVLTRQADARPGNGGSLQIRNFGQPLYVVDGIPKYIRTLLLTARHVPSTTPSRG